jgi:hypothetical protein
MTKKFYIIPKDEIVFTTDCVDADEAMGRFAWEMDSDMNAYFRAVTEEEYKEIIEKKCERRR